jgi:hypothetical protein
VKAPTVHLNGTSKAMLLDAAKDALTAVREARDRLQPVYPNGRDYYPQGPTAHRIAVDGWLDLDKQLRDVSSALTILVTEIADQGK